MNLAIMQPYFLPYIGYFQLMAATDRFIALDDAQYMKGGWINRNRIFSNAGIRWLTLPVTGASTKKKINEVSLNLSEQQKKKICRQIQGAYRDSRNFETGMQLFMDILSQPTNNLALFTVYSLQIISSYLSIDCKIELSSNCFGQITTTGGQRVLDICENAKASTYINAPGGRHLYNEKLFSTRGISLKFISPQLEPAREDGTQGLSILDVIMRYTRDQSSELAHCVRFA